MVISNSHTMVSKCVTSLLLLLGSACWMMPNTNQVEAQSQPFLDQTTEESLRKIQPATAHQLPTVVIAVIVEKHAVALPYSLFYLQRLDFPKSRISIWIHCSPSSDGSVEIVREWTRRMKYEYNQILNDCDDIKTKQQFDPVSLYHSIIQDARKFQNDYVLFVGADNILEESSVLLDLIAEQCDVIAPLLLDPGGVFKHWNGVLWSFDNYWHKEKENFLIDNHGIVQSVHGTVLIALDSESAEGVSFELHEDGGVTVTSHPEGPGISILKKQRYGLLPLPDTKDWGKDFYAIVLQKQLMHFSYLAQLVCYPEPSTPQGFDEVYVINLARRPERRRYMQNWMNSLGIKAQFTQAVDGWSLTTTEIQQLGVTLANNASWETDKGAMGCFLSHYNVWKDANQKNYSRVIIFEDDFRPRRHFTKELQVLLHEAEEVPGGWDIIYLFHVRVTDVRASFPPQPNGTLWNNWEEPHITDHLVKMRYSWSAIGYMVSGSGLKKLTSGDPYKNIVPVDVWLMLHAGIVTDQPQEIVDLYSPPLQLRVYAAWPLLGRPRYTWTDKGHLSDTSYNRLVNNVTMDPEFTPRLATNKWEL